MDKKTRLHLTVDASNALKALMMDTEVTTTVVAAYPAIKLIMLQLQTDTALKGDDDVSLQVMKGLGILDNTLLMFSAEGKKDIENEKNA